MTAKNEPPTGIDTDKIAEAFASLGKAVGDFAFTLGAQALLGHALHERHSELEAGLKALTPQQRRRVLTAAQVLAGSAYALSEGD